MSRPTVWSTEQVSFFQTVRSIQTKSNNIPYPGCVSRLGEMRNEASAVAMTYEQSNERNERKAKSTAVEEIQRSSLSSRHGRKPFCGLGGSSPRFAPLIGCASPGLSNFRFRQRACACVRAFVRVCVVPLPCVVHAVLPVDARVSCHWLRVSESVF